MKPEIKKFLDFNGTNIPVLSADGTIYVAIKPICTALGVDYIRQYKNIQEDEDLVELLSEQTTVAQDNKLRKMVCLPEEFIYGWLFSVKSQSPDFKRYKMKCYRVLYNYFHGATTERLQLLKFKSADEIALEEAELKWKEEMLASENYRNVQKLKFSLGGTNKGLKVNDEKLLEGQLKMFGE